MPVSASKGQWTDESEASAFVQIPQAERGTARPSNVDDGSSALTIMARAPPGSAVRAANLESALAASPAPAEANASDEDYYESE